jgi:hypothetical protein
VAADYAELGIRIDEIAARRACRTQASSYGFMIIFYSQLANIISAIYAMY